jgi:hypothetical protein
MFLDPRPEAGILGPMVGGALVDRRWTNHFET